MRRQSLYIHSLFGRQIAYRITWGRIICLGNHSDAFVVCLDAISRWRLMLVIHRTSSHYKQMELQWKSYKWQLSDCNHSLRNTNNWLKFVQRFNELVCVSYLVKCLRFLFMHRSACCAVSCSECSFVCCLAVDGRCTCHMHVHTALFATICFDCLTGSKRLRIAAAVHHHNSYSPKI